MLAGKWYFAIEWSDTGVDGPAGSVDASGIHLDRDVVFEGELVVIKAGTLDAFPGAARFLQVLIHESLVKSKEKFVP